MSLIALPRGFIRFSLALTAIVAASWWMNFELTPVAPTSTSFLPLFLLLTASRVILLLTLCGAGAGIGIGCASISLQCLRSPNRFKSPHRSIRYTMSCLSVVATVVVFILTYAIVLLCIGTTGFFFSCMMFTGLQVSEFLLIRRILGWRRNKEKVSL
ncbi:MAG: hypothetical protein ACYC19_02190 [Acidimicrobiales bacterium]